MNNKFTIDEKISYYKRKLIIGSPNQKSWAITRIKQLIQAQTEEQRLKGLKKINTI